MKRPRGFTLIELLVVVSIIALLVSILLPALSKARSTAKRVLCATNQRSIALAVNAYQADNEGRYPRSLSVDESRHPPAGLWPNKITRDWDGDRKAYSFGEKITDYMGGSVTFDVLICPLVRIRGDVYDRDREYYESGDSAWLYASYAMYWNYSLRPLGDENHFVGPGSKGVKKTSSLLLSDLCVYSYYHQNRWFVPHPPKSLAKYTDYLYGYAWEVPWPDESTLFPVKINVTRVDGSVSLVDSEDIVPVSFEYSYHGGLFVGVPLWATRYAP